MAPRKSAFAVAALAAAAPLAAATTYELKMRDGVTLHTVGWERCLGWGWAVGPRRRDAVA